MRLLRRLFLQACGDIYVAPGSDMAGRLDRGATGLGADDVMFGNCWCDDNDPLCPVTHEVHRAATKHDLTLAVDDKWWWLLPRSG